MRGWCGERFQISHQRGRQFFRVLRPVSHGGDVVDARSDTACLVHLVCEFHGRRIVRRSAQHGGAARGGHSVQLLSGLQALHGARILHRDIKPHNCLTRTDDRIKLADLGLAIEVTSSADIARETAGTIPYMAPEPSSSRRATVRRPRSRRRPHPSSANCSTSQPIVDPQRSVRSHASATCWQGSQDPLRADS